MGPDGLLRCGHRVTFRLSVPPGYRLKRTRAKPKLGPFLGRIDAMLAEDETMPRKQRHTAKRIFERLQEEGYTGGYTQVPAHGTPSGGPLSSLRLSSHDESS